MEIRPLRIKLVLITAVTAGILVASAKAALTIVVSADPPLPAQNLLVNPGFAAGDVQPQGWSPQMHPGYQSGRVAMGGRQDALLRLECLRSNMLASSFVVQSVPVEPDTAYVGGVWMRLSAGRGYLRLQPNASALQEVQRVSWRGNVLVPDFVAAELTGSPARDEWIWVEARLQTSADDRSILFGLGSFQDPGAVDFDDAFLGVASSRLTASVAGSPLKSVAIRNEKGEELWNSGNLGGKVAKLEHTLPDVSTMGRYEVVARDLNDQEIHKWYPAESAH
ncbi:hypothetical protein BH09VER1_BH09VER1_07720 [soil metagenome]